MPSRCYQLFALLLFLTAMSPAPLRVAAEQGVSVRRGQWISTGGITPCVMLPFGKPIQLTLGGKQIFDLIVQAQPTTTEGS